MSTGCRSVRLPGISGSSEIISPSLTSANSNSSARSWASDNFCFRISSTIPTLDIARNSACNATSFSLPTTTNVDRSSIFAGSALANLVNSSAMIISPTSVVILIMLFLFHSIYNERPCPLCTLLRFSKA